MLGRIIFTSLQYAPESDYPWSIPKRRWSRYVSPWNEPSRMIHPLRIKYGNLTLATLDLQAQLYVALYSGNAAGNEAFVLGNIDLSSRSILSSCFFSFQNPPSFLPFDSILLQYSFPFHCLFETWFLSLIRNAVKNQAKIHERCIDLDHAVTFSSIPFLFLSYLSSSFTLPLLFLSSFLPLPFLFLSCFSFSAFRFLFLSLHRSLHLSWGPGNQAGKAKTKPATQIHQIALEFWHVLTVAHLLTRGEREREFPSLLICVSDYRNMKKTFVFYW